MTHKRIAILIAIFASLLLSACASSPGYTVSVSGLARSHDSSSTYFLWPMDPAVDANDLQFLEYAGYVNAAIQSQGYQLAQDPDRADLIVFLDYGIGGPQQMRETRSVPVYGQTGVRSSTTYGTITGTGSHSTYTGTTRYTPTYGVTGYQQQTSTWTEYTRHLTLDAVDWQEFNRTEEQVQVWTVRVTSMGRTGDLRAVMPILVAASQPYIGRATQKSETVVLDDDDPEVLAIINSNNANALNQSKR